MQKPNIAGTGGKTTGEKPMCVIKRKKIVTLADAPSPLNLIRRIQNVVEI